MVRVRGEGFAAVSLPLLKNGQKIGLYPSLALAVIPFGVRLVCRSVSDRHDDNPTLAADCSGVISFRLTVTGLGVSQLFSY